ncbi:hypothetical protein BC827DRAFT_72226 [Russula dissimulans]|nr:hypothetical protein BC827DRAFT_72226 [Russula dissimulans]
MFRWKQLNEGETALRHEEAARKQKHISEEMKSTPRNRRSQLAGGEPATHTGNGSPAEGEVDEEESPEAVLTCYRWISALKASPDAPPGDKMLLSFFVPTSLLPSAHQPALGGDGDAIMMTQEQQQQQESILIPQAPAVCDGV